MLGGRQAPKGPPMGVAVIIVSMMSGRLPLRCVEDRYLRSSALARDRSSRRNLCPVYRSMQVNLLTARRAAAQVAAEAPLARKKRAMRRSRVKRMMVPIAGPPPGRENPLRSTLMETL